MVEINVIGEFNPALENKFTKDISALKKDDIAVLNITSHGGQLEVFKRMASKILALKQQGVKIATFVPDYAESAGFFLFLLGDEREIAEDATVHYHAPRVKLGDGFVGTLQNMSGIMSELQAYQDFTNSIFKASCDMDPALFSLLENSELPMNRTHLQTLGIIN